MAIYVANPQFATRYYGGAYDERPKNWYRARAKNKEHAIRIFAKRYGESITTVRKYGFVEKEKK